METYNRRLFSEVVGYDVEFVQNNHSRFTRASCEACITSCRRMRKVSLCG
jgi:hypothetical protein